MRLGTLWRLPGVLARKVAGAVLRALPERGLAKGLVGIGNLAGRFMRINTIERAFVKKFWETANGKEKEMIARILARLMKRRLR